MNSDSMTEQDTSTIKDKTIMPTADLDQKVDVKINGNGIPHPGPFSEYAVNGEVDAQKKQFNDHVRMIEFMMRDHGHTQFEVRHFERSLPSFNNATENTRQTLTDQLAQRRNEWAISNFSIYTGLLTKISPEQPERFLKLKDEFGQSDTSIERKAQISEKFRTELETVVHWKTMFYTEMLKTVMVDMGESPEKAEEIALLKAEEPTARANSMIEKVSTFETLRKEALTYLIEHLPASIMVWEELFPGEGQIEEDKILGEKSETRMKRAKDLYKRTDIELEKKRTHYRIRFAKHIKDHTAVEGDPIINKKKYGYDAALESERKLMRLPRIEQIRVMNSGRFI